MKNEQLVTAVRAVSLSRSLGSIPNDLPIKLRNIVNSEIDYTVQITTCCKREQQSEGCDVHNYVRM